MQRFIIAQHPTVCLWVTVVLALVLPGTVSSQVLRLGGEFQVNTYTTGHQGRYGAALAADADGNFVVVWSGKGQGYDDSSVFGQRYDSVGMPQGGEFSVNTGEYGEVPAVATDAEGDFVVVWQGEDQGGNWGVFGQRYDSAGIAQGTEFQVNTYTTGSHRRPAVSRNVDADFVVVWVSEGHHDGSSDGVFGQRYDSAGMPQGGEFQVNTYTTGPQRYPRVASAANGSFMVVWDGQSGQDGDGGGVFGQRYDSAGIPQGGEFQVNTYTTGLQYDPAVAADADGNFVVVWSSGGGMYGLFGQRYDSAGIPQGGEFCVSSSSDVRYGVDVATDSTGNFVVVWSGYVPSRGQDIFGQRYDSTGVPLGGEFLVNTYTTGDSFEIYPAVAADADGNFVVVWTDLDGEQDGSGAGVFGQRFGPDLDGDGRRDYADNCPSESNPDQLNTDCDGDPASDPGCSDGGDVCEVCPALDDNAKCDASRSGGKSVGSDGGTFDTPDGSITIFVPLGAVDADTSITVTDSVAGFFLDPTGATAPLYKVGLRPENQHFLGPVTITFRWDDRDSDGRVDLGTCEGGPDAGLTCDENADCPGSTCSKIAAPNEDRLLLKRNGTKFSKDGFLGTAPFECQDHLAGSGCGTVTANCADAPGTGMATVANCCNVVANEWTFQTCDFSEFILGQTFADLIPGNGSPKTDCVAEFAINNPQNDPFLDKKGLPNFKQACTDGDVLCDLDGTMNRQCVFEVGVCLNVPDERLVKKGQVACTPADVGVLELKKPRPDSKKQVDADNGEALRDAVLSLGAGAVGGKHQEQITFTPAVSLEDTCTNLVQVAVPLKGKDLDRQGRATIGMKSTTTSSIKDMDKLKLTCLPGSPSAAFLEMGSGLLD